jgi:thiol-disulfide isomerase/thioredoxin
LYPLEQHWRCGGDHSSSKDTEMHDKRNAVSRRVFIAGTLGAAVLSRANAQTGILADSPPPLLTVRSQFVEMSPLREVPELTLERIDGKFVSLKAFREKAVLVNFWATWCPPCRRELPLLEGLRQSTANSALEIVAVSIDQDGRQAVVPFLKRLNIARLRPYLDPQGRIAKQARSDAPTPFVLWGMPISYMIDRKGRLAGYITGEVDWASDQARDFLNYYAHG